MESENDLDIDFSSDSSIDLTTTDSSSSPSTSSDILSSDSKTDSISSSVSTVGNIFSKCPFCNGPYYHPWSYCGKGCKTCNYALPPKGDSRTVRKCFFRMDHIMKSHAKSCDRKLEILKAHNEIDQTQPPTYLLHCELCDFLTSI